MDEQNTNEVSLQQEIAEIAVTPEKKENTETESAARKETEEVASEGEEATAEAQETSAVVEIPAQPDPQTNSYPHSHSITFVIAVVLGVILVLFLRRKPKPVVVTFEEVCQYAQKLKQLHPEATSTMVSVVVNDKTKVKTLIQVALNSEGEPIHQSNDEIVGRQFPIADVDSRLKKLLGDDIKCIIPID